MEQRYSIAVGGDLGESVSDDAVGGFLEPFGEKRVIAVIVAKNAYEVSV